MKLSGADILWACLVEQSVDTVFGYPGSAILPTEERLLDRPIRHVLVRHEQSATHMADGYARASGRVGVAVATSGPGATNLVTGIATAMMDSIPLVCITGLVPTPQPGSDAFQQTGITGITLPMTRHTYVVQRAEDIAPIVREAFRMATSAPPGPVLVDIARSAQQEQAEWVARDPQAVEARAGSSQSNRQPWLDRVDSRAGGRTARRGSAAAAGPLETAQVITDIRQAIGERAVIVTDVGHAQHRPTHDRGSGGDTWITSGGLGTMGFALPAAIGAKLARPEAEVWAIVSDGGFQMTQAELATLVEEGIKVNIAIVNQGGRGPIRQRPPFGHDRRAGAMPLAAPDFVKIADAHGLPGVHVSTRDQSVSAIRHARASAGPVLIDFHVQQKDAAGSTTTPGTGRHGTRQAPRSASAESGANLR
jgi:thiamine pyrophosphate-dependent acetolactate synthase large subunit-like protein